MKKLQIIIILITTLFTGLWLITNLNNEIENQVDGLFEINLEDNQDVQKELVGEYLINEENGANFVKFNLNEINLNYIINNERQLTTKEVASENSIVINSGYFLENYTHAGFLKVKNENIARSAIGDSQITHFFNFDQNNLEISKEINQDFSNSFQTGPLLLEKGDILSEVINQSLNGKIKTFRSVLGFDDNQIYTGTFNRPITLFEVAEFMQNESFFSENITMINLDGAYSTSIYSSENSDLSFGSRKKLPFYLKLDF